MVENSWFSSKTTYTVYCIRTEEKKDGKVVSISNVKRRYTDFEALHQHLRKELSWIHIPSLPDKWKDLNKEDLDQERQALF